MKNKSDNHQETQVLFQYRPPAVWALENLCRGVMYFRSPLDFNDPYDCRTCRTPPVLRDLTDEQLAFLRGKKPSDSWNLPFVDAAATKSECIDKMNEHLEQEHGIRVKECGIACFSKRNDNLLMWSHYADGGKGFCLEFHDNYGEAAFDVQYQKKFPDAYDYILALAKGSVSQFPMSLLEYKYEEWNYEAEMRIIRGMVGEEFFPAEIILKAIYLGTEVSPGTRALARTIKKDKYTHAKLYEGKLVENESGVVFVEVEDNS